MKQWPDDVVASAAAQVRLTRRICDGVTFSEGQPINIRVPVSGHPAPRVTWLKDGHELLTEAGRREVWTEDQCAVLAVTRCQRTVDRGVYAVRVDNSLGADEASFTIDVTGELLVFFQ